jgi:hypothetical protein
MSDAGVGLQQAMANSNEVTDSEAREVTCFVIGPIGDKDADPGSPGRTNYEEAIQVFEEVIEPACRDYGIIPIRADHITRTGEIHEQVFRHLRDAYLVIADLTGANPNVMYELGVRHTSGKLTIQIGERERLPFDVSTIRTIQFRRSEGGFVDGRRKLSSAIGAGLDKGGDPVTATRVWFEDAATIHDDDGDLHDEELGFLEKLNEMAEGLAGANLNLTAIPEVMSQITDVVGDATTQLNRANASSAPASARVFITDGLAQALAEPASRLEVLAGNYRQSIERMDSGVTYGLREISAATTPSDDLVEFRDRVAQMLAAADITFPSITTFRDAALQSGEATRALRRVNRRIAAALQQILNTKAIFEGWKQYL